MVGTVKDARGYDAPPSSNNCGELKNMFTVKMAQQKSGPGWNSNYKEASKAASTLSDGPCEMPNGHGRSLVFPPPNCPELENSSRSSTGHESTSKQRMVFFRVEIANKRVENIPVWADCQLAHVGAALGENESVQVLYYLYEKLLKESCNIEDANVMVRLRPNWKCISLEDLIDDTSATLEEVFGDMLSSNCITWCLIPPEKCHQNVRQEQIMVDDAAQRDLQQQFADLFSRCTIQDLVDASCPFSMDFILDVYRGRYSCLTSVTTEQHKRFTDWVATFQAKKTTPDSPSLTSDVPPPARKREEGSQALSRLRANFDPLAEIPLLRSWFELDERPENEQIARYTAQLNLARPAKRSVPLEEKSVRIWFKNARAKKSRLAQAGLQKAGSCGEFGKAREQCLPD